MGSQLDVRRHIDEELAGADPWRLDSNPFEQQRFAAMLAAIVPGAPYDHVLEVGCAAGAFTQQLLPHCVALDLIDISRHALERTADRLGRPGNLTLHETDIGQGLEAEGAYDLIVVAEVLYLLDGPQALARAIDGLAGALKPGGLLVFGSAVDDACRRWGMFGGGAETVMAALSRRLRETSRVECRGADWGEDSRIVTYMKDARRPSFWSRLRGGA